ncbi:MAG: AtpZ/AtpI family protein [Candidatus Pacebacteria bacterium]|nr:AtpZ/AtpI family protein [Candidatus Paceibacterota bacterium]
MSSPVKNQRNKQNVFYTIFLGLELGFLVALPLVVFLVLGVFLDKKFETFPIFLISGIIIGLILTFVDIRYLILPFLEKRSKK